MSKNIITLAAFITLTTKTGFRHLCFCVGGLIIGHWEFYN